MVAHVIHGNRLEWTCAQLRRGDHHMINRAPAAEKIRNAFVTGDICCNRGSAALLRRCFQALRITGGNHNIGAFAFRQDGSRKANAG
jgi:hypothetical protein